MTRTVGLCFAILLVFFGTGCSSIVVSEQPVVHEYVELSEKNSIGQSFNARFNGLNGVEIYFAPTENSQGDIQLLFRENPRAENISQIKISLEEISTPGFHHFPIPIQVRSNQQNYYILMRFTGEGTLKVGVAPGNTFLSGALYQNGQPDDQHQMAFQLDYRTKQLVIGLIGEILLWGFYLSISLFLFVIPGWALVHAFWPRTQQKVLNKSSKIYQATENPFSKMVISIGISLSIYPILLLWTDLFGQHLGSLYAWFPPIAGCIYLGLISIQKWRKAKFSISIPKIKSADIVLIFLLLSIISTRFWVIRSLPTPLWGDSYHHTIITQLMIDNSGLFNSWHPYTQATTFTYHFGFHGISTVFHWITNIPAEKTILIVGQLINIFAVLSIYPLAMLLFKNKWSGNVAILIAGLLSPMPMFYTNWGRYTQLAGQVFLLIAVWLTWHLFKDEKPSWRLLIPSWMVVSALALTHYRVIIYFLVFIAAYLILHVRKNIVLPLIKSSVLIGVGAGIIFLPWFVNVFGGRILRLFKNIITKAPSAIGNSGTNSIVNSLGDLTTYLPLVIWIFVIVVLAICLWRKKQGIAIISLWWFILILLANPQWLLLPGKGILNSFAILIAVYIPASLILASLPFWFLHIEIQKQSRNYWKNLVLAITIIGLGLWGVTQRSQEIDPRKHAMAAYPDIRAAKWIQDNLPDHALFLVNAFFAYNNTVIVGSDGGWWLPLIAARSSTLPPMTYSFESEPFPEYNKWVQQPTRMIEEHGLTDPETLETLIDYGVTHVYVGQQQGSVNYSGPLQLNPNEMQSSSNFNPIYHQDRVWVFELIP
jgi:hypothetical protein